MAGLLGTLFASAMGGAMSAVKAGPVAKTAMGAAFGGIYGASQGESASSMFEGALKGTLAGAAGGMAVGNIGRLGSLGVDAAWGLSKAGVKAGYKFARGQGAPGAVRNAGMWALNNPLTVAGVAGGLYGAGAITSNISDYQGKTQSTESPYQQGIQSNISYNQQMMALQDIGQIGGGTIGTPQQMAPQFDYAQQMSEMAMRGFGATRTGRFVDSTVGLPQGLHNGRHS